VEGNEWEAAGGEGRARGREAAREMTK